jgi:hypothetical protein
MSLPFSERATLCCHAEFRPSGTAAFATTACFIKSGGVPFGAGAAGGFAGGEDFGRDNGEACASETARGVAESGEETGVIIFSHENEMLAVGAG